MRDPTSEVLQAGPDSARAGKRPRPQLIRGDAPRQLDLSSGSREQRRKRDSVRFEIDPNRKPPGGDPPAAA